MLTGKSDDATSGALIMRTEDSGTAGASGSVIVETGKATGGAGGSMTLTVGEGDTGNGGAMTLTAGKTTATSCCWRRSDHHRLVKPMIAQAVALAVR